MIEKDTSVLITGASGFIGTNMVRKLRSLGYENLLTPSSRQVDLINQVECFEYFMEMRPKVCFHLAGRVGGILANQLSPADFFYENAAIGINVLQAAWASGVTKMVAASAGCGYPESAPNPITEDAYWDGFPQVDSAPYSLAKRMLHIHSFALKKQYDFDCVIGIPGNVYGPHDNYNLTHCHVIPALVRKFFEGRSGDTVSVWGDGSALRDFVHVSDVVEGLILLMNSRVGGGEIFNISSGRLSSIAEVVDVLVRIVEFKGTVGWDVSKPAGQKARQFNLEKIFDLGYQPEFTLERGLADTVLWLQQNYSTARL